LDSTRSTADHGGTGRAPTDRNSLPTKVIAVLSVLFFVLLLVCVLAPWFGTDTTDVRREQSRPSNGWFPPIVPR
jgi:hypothetical protein